MIKVCSRCKQEKTIDKFGRNKRTKDGFNFYCKPCAYEQSKSQESYHRNVRKAALKRYYGITPEQYDGILEMQKGVCAICGNVDRNNKRLAVDHDHATGKIRGLLCTNCNSALGKFQDSPEIMRKAIQYITPYLTK